MKKLLLLLFLIPLFAADPAGFMIWKADDLKAYQQKLAPKVNENKAANEKLAVFSSYTVEVYHREGTTDAETHLNNSELFMIVSGEATEIIGGNAVDSKTIRSGEIRSSSINGGMKVPLRPGDVVRMPANTPHQMVVDAGKQITYIIVKEPVN